MKQLIEKAKMEPPHKRRFIALFISGIFTLIIFTIWSVVMFGNGGVVENKNVQANSNEVTPIQTITKNLATSFESVKSQFETVKNSVNLENEYQKIRQEGLNQNPI